MCSIKSLKWLIFPHQSSFSVMTDCFLYRLFLPIEPPQFPSLYSPILLELLGWILDSHNTDRCRVDWKSRKPVKNVLATYKWKELYYMIQANQRARFNKLIQMAQKPPDKHVPMGELTLLKFWKWVLYEEYNYILNIQYL